MLERGGLLEPTAKNELSGLGLGKRSAGGAYISVGGPRCGWGSAAEWGGCGYWTNIQQGGLGLLTWLPSLLAFSYPFPTPQSPLQLFIPPPYSPQVGWGLAVCVCGGLWLRAEQENMS